MWEGLYRRVLQGLSFPAGSGRWREHSLESGGKTRGLILLPETAKSGRFGSIMV
jgi:hypothetical protein